jgi:hypothetical protein
LLTCSSKDLLSKPAARCLYGNSRAHCYRLVRKKYLRWMQSRVVLHSGAEIWITEPLAPPVSIRNYTRCPWQLVDACVAANLTSLAVFDKRQGPCLRIICQTSKPSRISAAMVGQIVASAFPHLDIVQSYRRQFSKLGSTSKLSDPTVERVRNHADVGQNHHRL